MASVMRDLARVIVVCEKDEQASVDRASGAC